MLVSLKYLGKKTSVKFNLPVFKGEVNQKDAFWVDERVSDWLFKYNPKMFEILERKPQEPDEEFIEIESKPEPEEDAQEEAEPFVCEKCGKEYRVQWTYDRHVSKCDGKTEE